MRILSVNLTPASFGQNSYLLFFPLCVSNSRTHLRISNSHIHNKDKTSGDILRELSPCLT